MCVELVQFSNEKMQDDEPPRHHLIFVRVRPRITTKRKEGWNVAFAIPSLPVVWVRRAPRVAFRSFFDDRRRRATK